MGSNQCRAVAADDAAERQATLKELARKREEALAVPAGGTAPHDGAAADIPESNQEPATMPGDAASEIPAGQDAAKAAVKIQSGFRGLQVGHAALVMSVAARRCSQGCSPLWGVTSYARAVAAAARFRVLAGL